jgi:hypothetical protein
MKVETAISTNMAMLVKTFKADVVIHVIVINIEESVNFVVKISL